MCFLIVVPNAFMAFDAAVPRQKSLEYFGEDHMPLYGLSLYKETYWTDALGWLRQQDTEIERPEDRPAFISWGITDFTVLLLESIQLLQITSRKVYHAQLTFIRP